MNEELKPILIAVFVLTIIVLIAPYYFGSPAMQSM